MALTSADLVVEDGTGLDDANSYIDIAFADNYHRLRANTTWNPSTENDKVAALIRAADYVDRRYRYQGNRFVEDQALEFPRDLAFDVNGVDQSEIVPEVVKIAAAEYALRVVDPSTEGLDDLMPDPAVASDNGNFITLKREVVGPLEEETRYSDTKSGNVLRTYPNADRVLLLSGLVVQVGGQTFRA